ncbi:DUF6809 family protein [Oscillibacter sp.]|uniref:DUF6809 family protein n=1 Tax=Oscillibacter sp. TaxID=1945593 RepID=UPI002899723C|nr:DUF6809 family protein [Oscillibacter sp.]
MLEDLFYGNLHPCDLDSRRDPRIRPLMQNLADAEDALGSTLDGTGKKQLDAFANANADLNLLMMKLAFEDGFRIAAGLAADLYAARYHSNGRQPPGQGRG